MNPSTSCARGTSDIGCVVYSHTIIAGLKSGIEPLYTVGKVIFHHFRNSFSTNQVIPSVPLEHNSSILSFSMAISISSCVAAVVLASPARVLT